MVFCKKCGRYSNDGAVSCVACHADLKTSGHAAFQATPVKVTEISQVAAISKVPTITKVPTISKVPAISNAPAISNEPLKTFAPAPPALSYHSEADGVFDRDKFLLRQKALAIKEKYYVTDDSGRPLMFVE